MGIPVVIKPSGGLAVTVSGNGYGVPMTEATNGYGIAVTEATNGRGMGVTGITFGPDVTAPTITSTNTVSNVENTVLAHTLTASETVTWAKVGGADTARFEISGNTLRWLSNGVKDFETPNDADTNNAYVVQVQATDTALNASTVQTITVTVTDVTGTAPDAPVLDLLTDGTDNTPDFELTGDLLEGDTVRFQYSTSAIFSGASETTNTIDAAEDAANELNFSTGTLANGTWYFRARIERPGAEGTATSSWSNTETIAISVTSAALSWVPSTKTTGIVFSNSDRTVAWSMGYNDNAFVSSTTAAVTNQKIYVEHLVTAITTNWGFGFSNTLSFSFANNAGANTPSIAFRLSLVHGTFICADATDDTAGLLAPNTIGVGDRMCIAFNSQTGKVWVRKNNGTWNSAYATGDPATGTGGVTIPFAGPYYVNAVMDANASDVFTTAFASADWTYAAPSGFTQLAA